MNRLEVARQRLSVEMRTPAIPGEPMADVMGCSAGPTKIPRRVADAMIEMCAAKTAARARR